MKESDDFFKIWGGIAGVQSTLPILLTLGIDPADVARATAWNVAQRFKVTSKGTLQSGLDADLVLINLNLNFELKREDLLDRHKLSPYVGRTFRGVIRRTILRGHTIFMDGKTVGPPRGRLVVPKRS
jgi:allantoinase